MQKFTNKLLIKYLLLNNPEMLVEISVPKSETQILNVLSKTNVAYKDSMELYCLAKSPIIKDFKGMKSDLGDLVVIFDGIQDARNLGSCLRSCSFFGADSVIIPKTKSADFTNTAVIETSTGGIYDLNLFKVGNISTAIEQLKKEGYWIIGFSEHTDKDVNSYKFDQKSVLILGNEENGIRELVLRNCDQLLKISKNGQISSLNVSVATGIALANYRRNFNNC